jgi:hypothetical protein
MGAVAAVTREVLLGLWALAAALLAGCEVLARVSRGRTAGFDDVLGWLSATTWRLWAVYIGWMWLGWHFFAR